jgi:UDP-glucose 4-epimerase
LLTSTSEVYGKSQKPAFGEEDDLLIGPPHQARWSYACSKLMDEFLALAYAKERALPVIIARLFNTVGPRQTGRYGMVLPRFIAAARTGTALAGFRRWPANPLLLLRERHRRGAAPAPAQPRRA